MTFRLLLLLATASGLAFAAPRLFRWSGRSSATPKAEPVGGPNLLRLSRTPISIASSAPVIQGVQEMERRGVGAILVVEGDEVVGIFTERDVMLRVSLEKKDPEKTLMKEVMTSPVSMIDNATSPAEALKVMWSKHVRHLPVLGRTGRVEGMLSIRHLLADQVEGLESELDSLAAYVSADGIGG